MDVGPVGSAKLAHGGCDGFARSDYPPAQCDQKTQSFHTVCNVGCYFLRAARRVGSSLPTVGRHSQPIYRCGGTPVDVIHSLNGRMAAAFGTGGGGVLGSAIAGRRLAWQKYQTASGICRTPRRRPAVARLCNWDRQTVPTRRIGNFHQRPRLHQAAPTIQHGESGQEIIPHLIGHDDHRNETRQCR